MSGASLVRWRIGEDRQRPRLATSCRTRWRGMQAALAVWPLASEEAAPLRQPKSGRFVARLLHVEVGGIAVTIAEPRRSEGCVDATAEKACCRQWR